jgi:DNA polymerase II small subunit
MQIQDDFRRIIERVVSAGWQLDPEAFEMLRTAAGQLDCDKLIDELVAEAQIHGTEQRVINRSVADQVLARMLTSVQTTTITETSSAGASLAAGMESRVKVLRDPTDASTFGGSMEDFTDHFRDRFGKMSAILRRRSDSRDARRISDAFSVKPNERVKLIAMIMEKRERGGRLFLTVDDLTDRAQVLVPTDRDRQLYEMALKTPLDQVVCIEAVKSRSDLLVAERITLPDIPERRPKGADEEVYAALFSDIHIGSNKFLEEVFDRAILWLGGKLGTPNQLHVAQCTKYVIIAGDLVDGIGVYPRQEEELSIPDIYEQYKSAAKFIERIPEYIEVILIPGNHDAVRQALPQPAILKEFAEPVYEARAVTSLGNPCEVELHGVRFLLHHGRSLEDMITSAPGMSFERPEKAMELQLKCRHLAPEYGKRTSIAPSPADHLVIDEPPDVFHSGHIHVFAQESYRGTLLVNSGAWQAQTDYMARIGLKPTPGLLPVVNLQTLRLAVIDFMS